MLSILHLPRLFHHRAWSVKLQVMQLPFYAVGLLPRRCTNKIELFEFTALFREYGLSPCIVCLPFFFYYCRY